MRGRIDIEHAEFKFADGGGEIRYPAGDDDPAPAQPRQQFLDRGSGLAVIDIVEDHQPARMIFEPADRGGDFHLVLARVLLRQIENIGTGKRREAGVVTSTLCRVRSVRS
jgi:hypothetical protein